MDDFDDDKARHGEKEDYMKVSMWRRCWNCEMKGGKGLRRIKSRKSG